MHTYPIPVEVQSQAGHLGSHGGDITTQKSSSTLSYTDLLLTYTNIYIYSIMSHSRVHEAGSIPRSMAAFSAGRPKASHPIGWST